MTPERWEIGSEFHLDLSTFVYPTTPNILPWDQGPNRLYGCGRDAILEVLRHGRDSMGWRRIWIPDYFCQEVVATMASVLPPSLYKSMPTEPWSAPWDSRQLGVADVVLVANVFGLMTQVALPPTRSFSVIEDHTHDLGSTWATESNADFAVASLRKTLPVPDGGALWSPLRHQLPPAVNERPQRTQAANEKTLGMLQKTLYLSGGNIEKAAYRRHLTHAESHIAVGAPSPISDTSRALMSLAPLSEWRAARVENFRAFSEGIRGVSGIGLLKPESVGAAAFSCVLHLPSAIARNGLRDHLLANNIYPAILWPLERSITQGMPVDTVTTSKRLLSIHCDHRYSQSDMLRVAEIVADWGTQQTTRS